MFRHRHAVQRAQGTTSRTSVRRALALLTTTVLAAAIVPAVATPAQAVDYYFTGKVTGLSATGTVVPVPGSSIWIYDDNYDLVGGSGINSDGTYTANVSAPGPYRIEAGCWGDMACAPTYGLEWYANKSSFDDATRVTAGTTPTTVNIQLDRRSTISGRVTNTAGQPIAAAEVSVSPSAGGMAQTVHPDANGYFTMTGVQAGPSYLTTEDTSGDHLYETESWNGTASSQGWNEYTVPAGASVTGVNFVLDPWTGVIVTVTDEAGKPLQNIGWDLLEYRPAQNDWWGLPYGPKLTGADGTFAVGTDVGKTYKVCTYDGWYTEWNPALRYEDRCWDGATSEATATPITVTTETRRRELTMRLPVAGKSLRAVEPFVTGAPDVGGTLRVEPGTWGPTGVALTYGWTADGVVIPGATAATYVPTEAERGKGIVAQVTGTLSGYKTATLSTWRGRVGDPTPTMSSPLAITGSMVVGSTITATHGTITPTPADDASFVWLADGVVVASQYGPDADTFTLTSAHIGKRISVRMASGGAANELHTSATAAGLVQGVLTAPTPTISGAKAVGYTLTALPGTWGPAPVTLAYQWYRSGAAITGATAATYTLTASDLGKTMTVKVTGTKANYVTAARTSAATAAVLNGLTSPTPTITGTTAVGYTLTAVPGAWGPAPVTLAYQWFRAGAAISGATATTYKLTATDQGRAITVRVTGSKPGYLTVGKVSAATSAVLGTLTAPIPTITGTRGVGYTLTAVPGTWGPAPVTLAYQWYRSGTAITGATASTYKLTTADQTKTMTVRVTGSKAGYRSVAKTSAATTAVLGAFTTPTPTISGTRTVGYTLTAVPGTWSPTPTTMTYQWYRSGVAITGATAKTYKLVTLDKGRTIHVRVIGARSGYVTLSRNSAATAAIT